MTTPAVNENITLYRECFKTVKNADGDVTSRTLYASRAYSYYKKTRPESGNVSPVNGWMKCRPWTHSGYSWRSGNTTAWHQFANGTKYIFDGGSMWGNIPPPTVPSLPNSLISRAETQALTRLKNQDFHLGNFMAEFEQTERMIGNHILSIAKQVRNWRRRNPVQRWNAVKRYLKAGCGRRYARLVPRSWLEMQYGWKPLLSDIYGAIQHLTRPDREPLVSVKGYAKEEDKFTVNISGQYYNAASLFVNVSHEVWVKLYYILNSPGLAEVSSLGLLNPVEIIWELTSYSFVVDWVLPIGAWLGSLTADAGFSFKGGSLSRLSKAVGDGTLTRFDTAHGKNGGEPPNMEGSTFNFVRSCYTGSPVPGIYVKNPLSAVHVANAIALLVTAFQK